MYMRAVLAGTVIAEVDDAETIMIEGNHYFPPSALAAGELVESPTPYTCPWKGESQYYSLRSEEHTSELQSREKLVCRLLLEKKKTIKRSRVDARVEHVTWHPESATLFGLTPAHRLDSGADGVRRPAYALLSSGSSSAEPPGY